MKHIPIGTDDFRKIRLQDDLYVDKSLLVREVLNASEVLLLPRPRRFGKTLNMTMLQAFFDHGQDSRVLFDGLAISADVDAMAHLNAYPTIFLSLKTVTGRTWESCQKRICEVVQDLMEAQSPFIDLTKTSEPKRSLFEAAFSQKATVSDLASSLKLLTELLYLTHGKRVIILIDEYDTPIHQGQEHGYYAEVIDFFRGFLGSALKGNSFLERAVITGILRVAKESIYSGLNNLKVYSVLNSKFASYFGFTEQEVQQLLIETGSSYPMEDVQAWYNGYHFGKETIYNPWSILNMLDSDSEELSAHWINTSANNLIGDLVQQRQAIGVEEVEALLAGHTLTRKIEESVSMAEVSESSVWSLLLFSGYVTAVNWDPSTCLAELCLPNREVRSFFESTVQAWLGKPRAVGRLIKSLLDLEFESFARNLAATVKTILSYHDSAGNSPERVYHVFMVGLIAHLHNTYRIESNRQAGHGRADLCLFPRQAGKVGFVFEFKSSSSPKNLEADAQRALAQIQEQDYLANFRDAGVKSVAAIGLAFHQKRIALSWQKFSGSLDDPSKAVTYHAGKEKIQPQANDPGPKPDLAAAPIHQPVETDKADAAMQIQALQQERGFPVSSFEFLVAQSQPVLDVMLKRLTE